MKLEEVIRCHGHPNIRGEHRSTFQITTEAHLSPRGDCVIGIGADKGASDLGEEFRRLIADEGTTLVTLLRCRDISVRVVSSGSAAFTLDHPTDLVWRRSTFSCGRTIGICSDHTARTLPRSLMHYLKEGGEMVVVMTAYTADEEPD
ncbi:MAG TPA: DUF371 domain-containing protein [Methanoregulaceae archaeon]|nr:DUF371 domain-containing protein [Methanoregulaceae archaeon]